MSVLSFEGVSHEALRGVDASFGVQRHVVLGRELDGTNTLLTLAAGLAVPAQGRVLLRGVSPVTSAALRRRNATLFAEEELPPARSVALAVEFALRARGDARSASSVLDAAGLAAWAALRPNTLSARDTRSVALALALAHARPELVLLHEPLSLVGALSEAFILASLARFDRAVVLCTTSRLEEAAQLGRVCAVLERGQWFDASQTAPQLASITLRVHTPEARRLAARLSEAPEIAAVEWAGGSELLVRGHELESVARSVVVNARAEAIRIDAMRQAFPALEELVAARADSARAASERASTTQGRAR